MRKRPSISIACAALVLIAGCGSSGSSSGSSSPTATPSSSTPDATGAGRPGGGLKVTTTPKYVSPPESAPVHSGTVQISYRNIAIVPDALKVKVASTVEWTNLDAVEHNVTSDGDRSEIGQQRFASGDFGEGGTFQIKVAKPGVIHYRCTIHPVSMNGTIEVVQ